MASQTDEEDERDDKVSEPFIAAKIDKIAPLVDNNGAIAKAEEKAQKARSDLGNLYQKVENDFHGNRKAVKLVRTLHSGTTDAAHDFMRTFLPLAKHFNLIPGEDLVDLMGQEPEQPPSGEADEPGVNVADMAPKTKRDNVHQLPARENAIDRAKSAMAGGEKPPAPKGPDGDTDLVEAGDQVAEDIRRMREEDAAAFDNSQADAAPAA